METRRTIGVIRKPGPVLDVRRDVVDLRGGIVYLHRDQSRPHADDSDRTGEWDVR
jgi:hypothetical protein